MVENTVKQELEVATEIDRYIGLAGQALAYKIGQVPELRANAKLTLGETDSTFAPPPVAQGRRSAFRQARSQDECVDRQRKSFRRQNNC